MNSAALGACTCAVCQVPRGTITKSPGCRLRQPHPPQTLRFVEHEVEIAAQRADQFVAMRVDFPVWPVAVEGEARHQRTAGKIAVAALQHLPEIGRVLDGRGAALQVIHREGVLQRRGRSDCGHG